MSQIKQIIYHILNKEQQSEGTLIINPQSLAPNESHQKLLGELEKAYVNRGGKGFGVFDEDEDSFPMPRLLRDYLLDEDFHNLSVRMMNILLSRINTQRLSTGGKVFITHYTHQSRDYILIAILSDKGAFTADNWDIIQNEILDIEHLKFAGRIDLTAWQMNEKRYISFLKGNGDIAGYFKEFLACNDALFAQVETKKLVELLNEFSNEQNLDLETKSNFLARAQEYLREISDNSEPFSLETFGNRVYSENPQILISKIGNAENGVSDGFIPDKRCLKGLSTYTGKTKNWRLFFHRDAIINGDISIEGNKIIINNPTDEILRAFE